MKKTFFLLALVILSLQLSGQSQIKVTTANLNFRTSPQIEKNIILVIPKGTTILVDYTNQKPNKWIWIDYDGKSGYVHTNYLKTPSSSTNYSNQYNTTSSVKYYTNSKGKKVQSPTYYSSPPKSATAECRDGTYSFSQSRRGTCSHHGGVKKWL